MFRQFGYDLSTNDNLLIYAIFLFPLFTVFIVLKYLVRRYFFKKSTNPTRSLGLAAFFLFLTVVLIALN